MKDISDWRRGTGAAIVLLLAAVIVLAGCGSGLKTASGGATTATTTTKSAASSGAAPSSTSAAISGNSNSSFCEEAKIEQAQEDKNSDAFTGDSPADLQKFEEQGQAELKVFESKAPSQIKSAVQTIAATDDTLITALKAANWDVTKLDPTATQNIDSPAFEAAVTTIDNYLKQVCGIDPSDDPSDDAS